jgi:hypothetical protein
MEKTVIYRTIVQYHRTYPRKKTVKIMLKINVPGIPVIPGILYILLLLLLLLSIV